VIDRSLIVRAVEYLDLGYVDDARALLLDALDRPRRDGPEGVDRAVSRFRGREKRGELAHFELPLSLRAAS
jgi:hypothetical protein